MNINNNTDNNNSNSNRNKLKSLIETLLGFYISNKKFDNLIKEYNDYKYPISERINMILRNPRHFCVFVLKKSLLNVIDKTNVRYK